MAGIGTACAFRRLDGLETDFPLHTSSDGRQALQARALYCIRTCAPGGGGLCPSVCLSARHCTTYNLTAEISTHNQFSRFCFHRGYAAKLQAWQTGGVLHSSVNMHRCRNRFRLIPSRRHFAGTLGRAVVPQVREGV
jgi:hypothetical protein